MSDYPDELLSEDTEFVFFVYDDDPDDPRYSLWAQRPEWGVSMYERNREGQATWQKLKRDADYDEVAPSDDLRDILTDFVCGEAVDVDRITDLDPHEDHFVRAVHGTDKANPSAFPEPVVEWFRRLGRDD